MIPVKASGWYATDLTQQERELLIASGMAPINDVFFPLWSNQYKALLLYGGFGSGKSDFIQTDLLEKCMTSKYFKCFYGRKIKDDVRVSVHSKFITLIKRYNLTDQFIYSEQPNGSMLIKHKATGNTFNEFGANKPESLKSIDDPTHFFLEEMDQFTLEDFGVILSRLRTQKGDLQLYGAFNTARVFPDHWIVKVFFPERSDEHSDAEKETAEILEKIGVHKLSCNYTDNYFIDQADYYDKLKLAAAGDADLLEATANGEWGVYKPSSPAFPQFAPDKHVSRDAIYRPGYPVGFVVDFNLNPFCGIFFHKWTDTAGTHVHVFDQVEITQGSIPKMCETIINRYGPCIPSMYITGDAMGRRGEISQRDNASLYLQMQRILKMREAQFKLPPNPTHENSLSDCNYVLHHFKDLKIHPDNCKGLCRDLRIVETDAFGQIKKRNRTDESQRADFADTFRYLVNTWLKPWISTHQKSYRLNMMKK